MKSRVYPKYKMKYRVGKLAGVRASTRTAGQRDAVAFCRREGRVATCVVRSTRWAEEVLGSRDQDRVDAPARLPSALAPSGGLLAVGPIHDGRRSRGARPHHASRRSRHLDVELRRSPAKRPIHLVVDSTGLSVGAKGNGPRRSTAVAASEAGRSSISASTGRV